MRERDYRSMSDSRARWRAACALGGVALALLSSSAAANGRFPRAQRLIQDRESPELMALYGTYGLLITRDAGASWRHMCEAVTGAYAGEDPLLEIMADQRVVLRTDTGLSRSDASLCGYDAVLGSPADALQDITRDSASPNGILALTTALGDDGVFVSRLSASSDGGASFTPLGSIPPDLLERGLTLDVAPSQPDLIYVSGIDSLGRGKLARSTDRGQSFTGFEIPGLGVADPAYIAAVSALEPDRVFVRTDVFGRANDDFEARETASDALYFTPDGGQTWHQVLHQRGKLYGFALSPDERWVLAGFGDPVLPAIFVEPDELGLYRVLLDDLIASPDAPPWERIYDRGVTCLRWTQHGLFACVVQDENGFELGRASDANFSLADATPFEGLLRLPEVRPLECPAESAGAACLSDETNGWLATCGALRAQCSLDGGEGEPGSAAQPDPAAPGAGGTASDLSATPGAPASVSGMGGFSSSGGAGGAEGASGARASGAGSGQLGDTGQSRPTSGSCSAVAPPHGLDDNGRPGAWLVALLLLTLRRRGPRRQRVTRERGPRPRAPRRRNSALLLLLLACSALSLGGCGDGAAFEAENAGERSGRGAQPGSPPADCGGAGEDFVLGMSKTSPSGALTVTIVAAEPAPPLVGPNTWTLQLSTGGEALAAASVSLTGWMPQHGHGLSSVPLIQELEGGRYQIRPINLFMPQLWEFDVSVPRNDEREVVTFNFCVR